MQRECKYTNGLRQAIIAGALLCIGPGYGQATIRVWGSPQMSGVLRLWEQGFQKQHPVVRFSDELHGTAAGIAGLYTGVADIVVMGREIWPSETAAYQSVFSRKPLEIEVATGSYDTPKVTFALVIYVHRSNPLFKLTLDQVAAVFGQPRATGATAIRTWDQLGLRGEWDSKPIHSYNFDYDNDKSVFFRRRVLGDLYRWDSRTREFSNVETQDAGKLIIEALAQDPLGIGVSNPHYANQDVRALALDTGGKSIAATLETVRNRSYPLARAVYIYTNRNPGKPLEANVAAFLGYILSVDGQKNVAAEGSYLPLTPEGVSSGRRALEDE
jgi:phosphate transport system substrate-binding protein